MHTAFDGDVRICDTRGEEFAEGAEEEYVAGEDGPALFETIFEGFEDCVLEDGVDDEN